jgi:hypothetical protein
MLKNVLQHFVWFLETIFNWDILASISTLSMRTNSKMTLRIKGLFVALSITILSIEGYFAEHRILFTVTLSVIMLNGIVPNGIMFNINMLNVVLLSVNVLSV